MSLPLRLIVWVRSRALWFLGIDIEQIRIDDPRLVQDLPMGDPNEFNMVAVENLLVHTPSGHAFFPTRNSKQTLIRESSTWDAVYSINSHGYLPRNTSTLPRIEGTNCVIPVAQNYYHWLFDELPFTLSARQILSDKEFLVHGSLARYQESAIDFLEIKTRNVAKWIKPELTLLPKERHISGVPPIQIIEELRKTFLGSIEKKSKTEARIYVSRRNSTRSLPKESEFESQLEKIGFKILFLEEMDLFSQIEIFSNAKIIIGAHGAGLSNLVWSSDSTKIFELMPENFHNSCYEKISDLMNLEYRRENYMNRAELLKNL